MPFDLYLPSTSRTIARGKCSLDRSGNLRFTREDAAAAGLEGRLVALLYDPDNGRVALRSPRDNEPAVQLKSHSKKGIILSNWSANIRGPLKRLGVTDPAELAGVHDLMVKDDMLIFGTGRSAPRPRRTKPRADH